MEGYQKKLYPIGKLVRLSDNLEERRIYEADTGLPSSGALRSETS